jgi:hypothetical protein
MVVVTKLPFKVAGFYDIFVYKTFSQVTEADHLYMMTRCCAPFFFIVTVFLCLQGWAELTDFSAHIILPEDRQFCADRKVYAPIGMGEPVWM